MTNFQETVPTVVEQEKLHELYQKHMLQFQKEKTALKFYMLGKGYNLGLKALGFLERHSFMNEDGTVKLRKDKRTPEMHHMIRIAFSVTQLRDVQNEELCIVLALLHDTQEDEAVQSETIKSWFGLKVANKNWKLTKKFAGQHKSSTEFYGALAEDGDASIVKGLDRCDNLENMIGVFHCEKIRQYCDEAENVYLPMLHQAAKIFPEQQHAYYAIRIRMKRAIKAGRDHADSLEKIARQKVRINELVTKMNEEAVTNQEKVNEVLGELDLVEKKLAKAYELTGSNVYEEHEKRVQALIGMAQEEHEERRKIFRAFMKACHMNSKQSLGSPDTIRVDQVEAMLKISLGLHPEVQPDLSEQQTQTAP